MIDLEKLKPIIEPLGIGADVIESIVAIDEPVVNNTEEIDRLNGEIERISNEWNDRFKKAFFSPQDSPITDEAIAQTEEQSGEETEITTFEELFKEE